MEDKVLTEIFVGCSIALFGGFLGIFGWLGGKWANGLSRGQLHLVQAQDRLTESVNQLAIAQAKAPTRAEFTLFQHETAQGFAQSDQEIRHVESRVQEHLVHCQNKPMEA